MAKNSNSRTRQSESFKYLQETLRHIACLPQDEKRHAYATMRQEIKDQDQARRRHTSYKARDVALDASICEATILSYPLIF
jgi:hypothetical protein